MLTFRVTAAPSQGFPSSRSEPAHPRLPQRIEFSARAHIQVAALATTNAALKESCSFRSQTLM
jgi:hypothetical protein